MKLAITLTVLGLVATCHALKCKSCKSETTIPGAAEITFAATDKMCSEEISERNCPDGSMSCLKTTDPKNEENVARGCSKEDKDQCTGNGLNCYCKGELCNGSGRGWPSAVLLLAALAAALVGGR